MRLITSSINNRQDFDIDGIVWFTEIRGLKKDVLKLSVIDREIGQCLQELHWGRCCNRLEFVLTVCTECQIRDHP